MTNEDKGTPSNILRIQNVKGIATSSAVVRRRLLNLAAKSTPHFDEMMCALGKLVLAFNILEHEFKSATAYLLDPKSSDLSRSEVSERKKLVKRINQVKRLAEEKLSNLGKTLNG